MERDRVMSHKYIHADKVFLAPISHHLAKLPLLRIFITIQTTPPINAARNTISTRVVQHFFKNPAS